VRNTQPALTVHIAQFAALLRDRQVVIAFHERALFDYLTLELHRRRRPARQHHAVGPAPLTTWNLVSSAFRRSGSPECAVTKVCRALVQMMRSDQLRWHAERTEVSGHVLSRRLVCPIGGRLSKRFVADSPVIDQLKEIWIDGELDVVETANWVPNLTSPIRPAVPRFSPGK
jgi:hypothetical protein